MSQRFSGYEPHPPNARGVPGRGPSRSRISVFCQTKRRGILATAEARTQCQGGYRVGVLRAKSDFRFLPDKNGAGFSQRHPTRLMPGGYRVGHPPNARRGRALAHSDFRFLPDENDAGFSQWHSKPQEPSGLRCHPTCQPAPTRSSNSDGVLLHLLTSGCGTTRLYPDVRSNGEYWRVSGLTADRAIKAYYRLPRMTHVGDQCGEKENARSSVTCSLFAAVMDFLPAVRKESNGATPS